MMVTLKDLRQRLSEILNRAGYAGEQVAVTRHGKTVAFIVSPADVKELARLRAERVSPEFREIAERVLGQNKELFSVLGQK